MGGASPKKQQPPPPPEEFIEAKTPAWKRSLARYHQGIVHHLRKLLNLSAAFWWAKQFVQAKLLKKKNQGIEM